MPCRSSFQTPTKKIQIIRWRSLLEIAYTVNSVEDHTFIGDGGKKYTNSIIELVEAFDDSKKRRVWLPPAIRKKLKDQMVAGKITYILPRIKPEQCLIDCI